MANVSPVTNAVRANIEEAIIDLRLEKLLPQTVHDMVKRDIAAMTQGGPEQGQHFIDAGRAWSDGPNEEVAATYRAFHEAYKAGWIRLLAAYGLEPKSDWQLDAIVWLQTALAESSALQIMNGSFDVNDVEEMLLVFDPLLRAWTRQV